jgi:hypothetical protein
VDSRNRQGQFARSGGRHVGEERGDEQLERIVQFRIGSDQYRITDMMFSQCRQQFGWQTNSDMYRDLMKAGIAKAQELIKKPSRDMQTAMAHAVERDRMAREAQRHQELEHVFVVMDDSIEALTRAGDLGSVREILSEFQTTTKNMTDGALRHRREVEFERRWSRLDKDLNRVVSLKPSDAVDDREGEDEK